MKKNMIKYVNVFLILVMAIGLAMKELTPSNDTFYMIKLGQYIVNHGIDGMDHFSWIKGLPYTYPHFLFDIYLYFIYSKLGFLGLYVNNILTLFLISLSIYYMSNKITKNSIFSLIVSIFFMLSIRGFIVPRSMSVSIIIFLWEVYFINKIIETGKNRYIVFLVILSWLLATTHGTAWLFYFILFLPFIGEHIISKILKEKKNNKVIIDKVNNINKVYISLILSFLIGLLTPNRVCYYYVFKIMMGDSQSFIDEHLPIAIINYPYLILLIIVFLIAFYNKKLKVHLSDLFMIFGLLFLSLLAKRHLIFIYTIGFLYIVSICNQVLEKENDHTFETLEKIIIANKKVLFIIIISISLLSFISFNNNYKKSYLDKRFYPVGAVKYIKNNLDYKNMKIYNQYDDGSYLLFNDIPVYIDSRCDLYLKEFNGMKYSIFDEAVTEVYFNYKKIFKKYGITHLLINKSSKFGVTILNDENYKIIYQDKNYVLFKKV